MRMRIEGVEYMMSRCTKVLLTGAPESTMVSIFQLLSFYEDGRTISEPGEVNLRRLAACVCASLHIHGTSDETSIGCTSCFASRKEKLNCLFCAPEVRQNGSEILDFEREVPKL